MPLSSKCNETINIIIIIDTNTERRTTNNKNDNYSFI